MSTSTSKVNPWVPPFDDTRPDIDLVPLFAYGTLRPGHALHDWVAMGMRGFAPATAAGFQMHNAAPGKVLYPCMSRSADPASAVVGDVLFMERGVHLNRTAAMEVAAGYTPMWVDVCGDTLTDGGGVALAFVWEHSTPGWPVPSGDWSDVERPIRTA
jgi:gamma-glutamylcyclotransferase (GGCT)/AIG2-like uncharacterized protein YtfP